MCSDVLISLYDNIMDGVSSVINVVGEYWKLTCSETVCDLPNNVVGEIMNYRENMPEL